MSSEKLSGDLNKYLPWAIIVVLGIWIYRGNSPSDVVGPSIEKTTSQVLPAMRKAYADVFAEAATEVEAKKITTDRQLLDFIKPKIESARKASQSDFDKLCEESIPESFSEVESEVASFLKRISKSW
jgi:hypothetical protein